MPLRVNRDDSDGTVSLTKEFTMKKLSALAFAALFSLVGLQAFAADAPAAGDKPAADKPADKPADKKADKKKATDKKADDKKTDDKAAPAPAPAK
jgi:hypothetical protein